MENSNKKCKKCSSTKLVKFGFVIRSGGPRQRFVCKSCGHTQTVT